MSIPGYSLLWPRMYLQSGYFLVFNNSISLKTIIGFTKFFLKLKLINKAIIDAFFSGFAFFIPKKIFGNGYMIRGRPLMTSDYFGPY